MTEEPGSTLVSRVAQSVQPSATLAAAALAKQMRAEGITVYDFSVGEPDFNTPDHVWEAAFRAMKEGHTHYTPAPGTLEARRAIVNRYQQLYDLTYRPEEIIISNGAKHSLHNALTALCGPGDEVLIPVPYWVSYVELVKMTGANPVLLPTTAEKEFKLQPEQLRTAISPQTKVLMLNSPSNPTGSVYSREELQALANVLLENQVVVISDEIYEQLIYEGEATCFPTLHPTLKDRTLVISGVSKSYAMTGWRIGWTLGPASVIKAMTSIQSQQTGNPGSVSQQAMIAALQGDQQCVADMRAEFQWRRQWVVERLTALPGIRCTQPRGAFYAFFDVSEHLGRTIRGKELTDATSFCQALLQDAHVNLVTGEAFGASGFVRMSYAASREDLKEGLQRLEAWLQ